MDIGAAQADDQSCYFIIGRQEKTRIQCSDQLEQKIALKLGKKEHCRPKFGR